jgi:predicted alpha/beta hydrolase
MTATSLAEIKLTDEIAAASGLPKNRGSPHHTTGTMLEAWEHYANSHVVFTTPTLTNHTVYKSMNIIIKNIIQEQDEWAVIASPLGAE